MHIPKRRTTDASSLRLLALLTFVVACSGSDSTTAPGNDLTGIRIVAGAGTADTIDAEPAQALIVEVRNTSGAPAKGAIVLFTGYPSPDPLRRGPTMVPCVLGAAYCFDGFTPAVDTTDTNGRARVRVRFGRLAGVGKIRIAVPDLAFTDSASYTVRAGAAAAILVPAVDTAIIIGETIQLPARVSDRAGNILPALPSLVGESGSAVVDSTRNSVTGARFGAPWIQYRFQLLRDSTLVRVLPDARIVAWSTIDKTITMLDLTGRIRRVLASNFGSDIGTFPHFDATGQRVTLHRSNISSYDPANVVTVLDTSGGTQRDIPEAAGFTSIITTRLLADGTILVAGRRTGDAPAYGGDGFKVFRISPDNAITRVASLPTLVSLHGGVDFSKDGTRVAFVAPLAGGRGEIRAMTLATGLSVSVAPDGSFAPRWSPSGAQLAYLSLNTSFTPAPEGSLVVVNVDGTGRTTISGNAYLAGCAWSPDAVYVICRESSPRVGLRVTRVSDQATVPLRYVPGDFRDSYVQPDWR